MMTNTILDSGLLSSSGVWGISGTLEGGRFEQKLSLCLELGTASQVCLLSSMESCCNFLKRTRLWHGSVALRGVKATRGVQEGHLQDEDSPVGAD